VSRRPPAEQVYQPRPDERIQSPPPRRKAKVSLRKREEPGWPPPHACAVLGSWSLGVSGFAFLFAWLPIVSLLSIPLSGLGLLLGLAGGIVFASRNGERIGLPVAGSLVSLLVCALSVFLVFAQKDPPPTVAAIDKPAAPPPEETEPETPADVPEAEWVDVSKGDAGQGAMRVRVSLAMLGPLAIQLEVKNVGKDVVHHHLWGASSPIYSQQYPVLRDNLGTTYERAGFGLDIPREGPVRDIPAGGSVVNVLSYAAPPAAVEYLRLEVDAQNFGGKGKLLIHIPRSMIPGSAAPKPTAPVVDPVVETLGRSRKALADPEPAKRAQAAAALRELGARAGEAVPELTELVNGKEEALRVAAAEALGRIGPPAVVAYPALVRASADLSDAVRRAGTNAMKKVGPATKSDVPVLAAALRDPSPGVRADAALALEGLGKEAGGAVQPLQAALADHEGRVRVRAAKALWEIMGPSVLLGQGPVGKLLAGLKEPEGLVRREAAEALSQVVHARSREGGAQAVLLLPEARELIAAIQDALEDEDAQVRLFAAECLVPLDQGRRMIVPRLLPALKDPDARVRVHAAEILWLATRDARGNTKKTDEQVKKVVETLTGALTDKDTRARRQAVAALGQLAPSPEHRRSDKTRSPAAGVVQALGAALGDGDALVRQQAAGALRKFGPYAREAYVALRLALQDTEEPVRRAAEGALRTVGPPKKTEVPALAAALGDPSARVRAESALARAALGPQALEAVPDLMRARKDASPEVRKNALAALAANGVDARAGVHELCEALNSADVAVRTRAALTLAGLGSEAAPAVPVLVSLLNDPKVGAYAARALAGVGEDAVPALLRLLEDGSALTRKAAVKALGEMGPAAKAAVPALDGVRQSDPSAAVRSEAKAALDKIRSSE
jgi:HEAT repeat protein